MPIPFITDALGTVSEIASTIGRVVSALQGATSPVIDDSVYCRDRAEEVLKGLEDRIQTRTQSTRKLNSKQRSEIYSKLYQLFCDDQSIQLSKRLYSTTESLVDNENRRIEFLNLLSAKILKSLTKLEDDEGFRSSTFSVNSTIYESLISHELRSAILQVIADNLKSFRLKVASSVYDCSQLEAQTNFYRIATGEIDFRETEVLCVKYPSSIIIQDSDMGYLPLHQAIRYRTQLLVDPKGGQDYCDNIIITLIMNGADPLQTKEVGTGIYIGRYGTQTTFEQLEISLDKKDIPYLAKLIVDMRCKYLKINQHLVDSNLELQTALKLMSVEPVTTGRLLLEKALTKFIASQQEPLLLAGPASARPPIVEEITDFEGNPLDAPSTQTQAGVAPLMIENISHDPQSPVRTTIVRSPVLMDSPRRPVQTDGPFASPLALQTRPRELPTMSP